MAEKKFYWLKLKKDFFKRHDIRIIESMENGKEYVLFYMKLMCESVDHDGKLRFSDTIPYNEKMLATITDINIDIVRSAMKVFTELGLVEILDDQTIYLNEVERILGSETANAERQRRSRALRKNEECDNVTASHAIVTECHTEIELERDKELETETEKEGEAASPPSPSLGNEAPTKSDNYKAIIDYLNEKAGTAFKASSRDTQKHINARLKEGFTVEDFKTVIDKKCTEWKGTEWASYLRPMTLFGSKFESYLNSEIIKPKKNDKSEGGKWHFNGSSDDDYPY